MSLSFHNDARRCGHLERSRKFHEANFLETPHSFSYYVVFLILYRAEEKILVKQVIEKYLKVTIDVDKIYDCTSTKEFEEVNRLISESNQFKIVWTPSMKRLFTLVSECLKFKVSRNFLQVNFSLGTSFTCWRNRYWKDYHLSATFYPIKEETSRTQLPPKYGDCRFPWRLATCPF